MQKDLYYLASRFRFHKQLLKEYESDMAKVAGWVSREAQVKRFEALKELANFSKHSLLDAGCGAGCFLGYLKQFYPDIRYYGVEQIPALLEIAGLQYGECAGTSFLLGDFMNSELPNTDYIIACGSLNYRNADPEFIFKAISKLFNNCRLGLGFNLLRATAASTLLQAYDPALIINYCESLTPKTTTIQNYWPDDFTVMMYH